MGVLTGDRGAGTGMLTGNRDAGVGTVVLGQGCCGRDAHGDRDAEVGTAVLVGGSGASWGQGCSWGQECWDRQMLGQGCSQRTGTVGWAEMLSGDRDTGGGQGCVWGQGCWHEQGCWDSDVGTGMLVGDGDAYGASDAHRDGDGGGDTGTLTGDGGAVAGLVRHDELVLEAAAPHTLRPDEHQRFPAERGHPGHLLVDQQLMAVELCARDGAVTRWRTPSRMPWGPQGTSSQEVPPRARTVQALTGVLRRQVHHPLLPLPAEAATQGPCRGHGAG